MTPIERDVARMILGEAPKHMRRLRRVVERIKILADPSVCDIGIHGALREVANAKDHEIAGMIIDAVAGCMDRCG